MKVSKVVLAAITATVIASSCTKAHQPIPTTDPQNSGVENPTNSHQVVDSTFQCPACGMG